MPGGRTRDRDLGLMRDPPVERAVDHDLPAVRAARHLEDGHALQLLQRVDIIGALHLARRARQVDLGVHVFVVDGDDLVAVDLEQLHAVGVFAEHAVGAGGGNGAFLGEPGRIREERIAIPHQRSPFEACRNVNRSIRRDRNALERETRLHRFGGGGGQKRARSHGRGTGAEGKDPAQEPAAGDRRVYHAIKVVVGRARIVQFVPLVPAQLSLVDVFHRVFPTLMKVSRRVSSAPPGTKDIDSASSLRRFG